MISIRNLTKKFGDSIVVNDVSLSILQGDIIGLVGANGAGKSTLVKILQGEYPDYTGTIEFNGHKIKIDNPYIAIKNGIAVVSQEPTISPNLTVLENLFLGRELTTIPIGWLDIDEMKNQVTKILHNFEADFQLDDKVRNLTKKQTQIVEIVKAFLKKPSLLILDEPTTSLGGSQIEILYTYIHNITTQGTIVILVSHNLEQILELSKKIAILRDGNLVSFSSNQNITIESLHYQMFGELSKTESPSKISEIKRNIIFEAKEISMSRFTNLSFQIYSGEIVGIIAPYTESPADIIQAIFGITALTSGSLIIEGKTLFVDSPKTAIESGIGYLPSSRRKDGLFWERTVVDNMMIVLHNRLFRFGWIKWKNAYSLAGKYSRLLSVKLTSLNQSIKYLSGGNQQKVLLARWFLVNSTLLLLDEPFSGIDIKSRQDLLKIFHDFQEKGKSALLISNSPDDLMQLCNRFMLMRNGKIERIVTARELSINEITAHMEGRN